MKRPRFIAGAICPACGAMDRLQVRMDGEVSVRHCVRCGHEDRLAVTASRTPKSRLDVSRSRPAGDHPAQPVRILKPPLPSDPDEA